jgi:hypothetical protein
MGIDRIGKGGAPPLDGAVPAAKSESTGATFEVNAGTAVSGVDKTAPSLVDKLKRGEISLDAYIDAHVQKATQGLGALPPQQLQEVQSMLRDRMRTDPDLADLFQRATGASPPTEPQE